MKQLLVKKFSDGFREASNPSINTPTIPPTAEWSYCEQHDFSNTFRVLYFPKGLTVYSVFGFAEFACPSLFQLSHHIGKWNITGVWNERMLQMYIRALYTLYSLLYVLPILLLSPYAHVSIISEIQSMTAASVP